MAQTYRITGMHCASCVQKITTALQAIVPHIHVTLNPPRAVLDGSSLPDLKTLNDTLAAIGDYALAPLEENAATDTTDTAASTDAPKSWFKTYYPLLLLVTMIALVSLRGADGIHAWMLHFMAGFFLVFGTFKLIDLPGFRDAYATYDLLAKRWHHYGLIYPFLEIALGFAFLFGFHLHATLWASILLMGFSSIGVILAVREKRAIRCACLGTALNLPMSTITIVEDLGMVAMSAWMLAVL